MSTVRNHITLELGGLKPQIAAASARDGLRPAPWIRRLVENALHAEPTVGTARAATHRKPAADDVKLTVRLTAEESAVLVAAARNAHLSQAEFVARVATTPGAGTALPQALQILAESNRQLLALGRNLNQIARKLNEVSGAMTDSERALIVQAAQATMAHAELVAQALAELSPSRRSRGRERGATRAA